LKPPNGPSERYFFKLQGSRISYFKDSKSDDIVGTIVLDAGFTSFLNANDLVIKTGRDHRVYTLHSSSNAEVRTWFRAVERCKKRKAVSAMVHTAAPHSGGKVQGTPVTKRTPLRQRKNLVSPEFVGNLQIKQVKGALAWSIDEGDAADSQEVGTPPPLDPPSPIATAAVWERPLSPTLSPLSSKSPSPEEQQDHPIGHLSPTTAPSTAATATATATAISTQTVGVQVTLADPNVEQILLRVKQLESALHQSDIARAEAQRRLQVVDADYLKLSQDQARRQDLDQQHQRQFGELLEKERLQELELTRLRESNNVLQLSLTRAKSEIEARKLEFQRVEAEGKSKLAALTDVCDEQASVIHELHAKYASVQHELVTMLEATVGQ
jgi:hypothetical protein